jgi:hypothetical protein
MWAANGLGGLVLLLLLIDPARDLGPVFLLLAVSVAVIYVDRLAVCGG